MKKRKKRHSHEQIVQSCVQHNTEVYFPGPRYIYTYSNSHSWFDIKSSVNNADLQISSEEEIPDSVYYVRKFLFKPTTYQKDILKHWFSASTYVYNEFLKIIKDKQFYKQKRSLPSFIKIRDEFKNVRDSIKNDCKYKIATHMLDRTINKCVANYKSLLTNFRNGNIKKFRARYYKTQNAPRKTLYLEHVQVNGRNEISGLGKVKLFNIEGGKEYIFEKKNVKHDFEIKYDLKENIYYIIIVYKKQVENENKEKEQFISLDPGLYPFLAGVSERNALFIGENVYGKVNAIHKKLDKCSKSEISKKKKDKYCKRLRKKLKNKINDLHWKAINYLTNKFNEILIGDLSAKGVLESNGIKSESKNVLSSLNLFTFRQRLESRCIEKGIKYSTINEYLTSKTCSLCGNKKDNLGLNKLYFCEVCRKYIHRDINGARCIYYVSKID